MIKYDYIHSPDTKLMCDMCRKTFHHILHIGTFLETFLFCKKCLLKMAEEL
jgi:hypothetical protein